MARRRTRETGDNFLRGVLVVKDAGKSQPIEGLQMIKRCRNMYTNDKKLCKLFNVCIIMNKQFEQGVQTIMGCPDETPQSFRESYPRQPDKSIKRFDQAIIISDIEGKVKYLNPDAEQLYGSKALEKLGQNILDVIVPPAYRPRAGMILAALQKGELYAGDLLMSDREGKEFHLSLQLAPLKDDQGTAPYILGICKDITAQKQAEKELLKSEKKYRQLVELAQAGIWSLDNEARTTFVNPLMAEMLGYTVGEMVGRPLFDFMDERHAELAKEYIVRRQRGIVEQHHFEFSRKDNALIWCKLNTAPIFDEDGSYAGALAVVEDITARKLVEEKLLNSEETLNAVINAIPESVFLMNPEGICLALNKTTAERLGKHPDDLLGKNLYDFLPKEVAEGRKARLAEAVKTGKPVNFIDQRFGAWIDQTLYPVFDESGQVARLAVVARDITGQRALEESLSKLEARYQSLFENSPDAIMLHDGETILEVNPAFSRMLGYDHPQDLVGMEVAEVLHPEERKVVQQRIGSILQDGKETPLRENKLVRKDGELVFAEGVGAPCDYRGQKAVQAIFRDVTGRKEAEQRVILKEHAIESSINAIAFADLEGNLTYVNPAFLRMWGYSDPDEVLGRDATDFWASKEQANVNIALLKEQGGGRGEMTAKKKDGSTFEVDVSASVVFDENHKPLAMMAAFIDITERKQAEQSLRAAEARYHSTLDIMMEGCAIIGFDWRYLYVNETNARFVHLKREEMVGRSMLEIFADFDHTPFFGAYKRCMEERVPIHLENEFTIPDGTTGTFEVHAYPVPEGIFILSIDVTEKKKAEKLAKIQLSELSALREIDQAITGSTDLQLVLRTIASHIKNKLNVDAISILLFNPHDKRLNCAWSSGFRYGSINRNMTSRIGEGCSGRVALERRTIYIPDFRECLEAYNHSGQINREGFVSYYGVPLLSKGDLKGVMEIFHRSPLQFSQENYDFMEALAGQAAISIDNTSLFEERQRSHTELFLAYETTIEGWSRALDLRDKETEGHTQRVTDLTIELARVMGMSEEKLVHVRRGRSCMISAKWASPTTSCSSPASSPRKNLR